MSELRTLFTSRYGEKGVILELDYKQLEIFVLAHLSQDEQLIQDLVSGVDIHNISAQNLFGPHYTSDERRVAKRLSFELTYGAGAKSMADKHNIPLKTARKFIHNFYERYPQVGVWQNTLIDSVNENRVSSLLMVILLVMVSTCLRQAGHMDFTRKILLSG